MNLVKIFSKKSLGLYGKQLEIIRQRKKSDFVNNFEREEKEDSEYSVRGLKKHEKREVESFCVFDYDKTK